MGCRKCDLLTELYEQTPKTPRDYWVMTELFVELHGFDYCNDRESRNVWAGFNLMYLNTCLKSVGPS